VLSVCRSTTSAIITAEPVNEKQGVNRNIVWQQTKVTREDRERVLGQRGRVVWFTGLSGSGKSTLAAEVERELNQLGRAVYLLDGDNLRFGLCSDLGFTADGRRENIRRIGEVSRLFADAGIIVLAAFISPYRKDRQCLREKLDDDQFIEVHVSTPLEVCEERDVKGLYEKARKGEIEHFTGISAPYEEPVDPEVRVDTSEIPLEKATELVIKRVLQDG
jgi:adenylyl-sulfate kinase